MSDLPGRQLRWVHVGGPPREIGRGLGRAGHSGVREALLDTDCWRAVTSRARSDVVLAMERRVASRFPHIHEEIAGLAEGLDLPFEEVFAWNCRGELMSNLPDGCTTLQIPGDVPLIAHNEDGLPGCAGHCCIAEVAPAGRPGFIAPCYPGSIPGHTFAITQAGMVQTVNNLRLRSVAPDIPRMVLGRAVLDCHGMQDAIGLLSRENRSGGIHFTLAEVHERRVVSVEFGGGRLADKTVTAPSLHANHALFLDTGAAGQTITRSSADRQARGAALVAAGKCDPLAVLRDVDGPGLPMHRTAPDDPDCENTLATVVLHVRKSGVEWRIYDQTSKHPVFASGRP